MADNEGNGDKDEAPPLTQASPNGVEESDGQSQMSEASLGQEVDFANNPRGVSTC